MKLPKIFVNRPVTSFMLMLFVILLGVVSFTNLKFELMPKINPPIVAVMTAYPGAGPEEVKEMVTKPIESSVSTSPGLESIESQSSANSSLIIASFKWGQDINEVRQDLSVKLAQVGLPEDVQEPMILKFDPTMIPIMQVSVENEKSLQELQKFVEQSVVTKLSRVDGVAQVDVAGTFGEEVQVSLDNEKLEKNNLTQQQVVQFIQGNNVLFPGGVIETEKEKLSLKISNTITDIEELKKTPISIKTDKNGTSIVYLEDVASVNQVVIDRTSVARNNQEESLVISIQKEGDANTVEVSQAVMEEIAKMEEDDEELAFSVTINQGEVIEESIGSVGTSLALGGLFAVIVILLFLRSFRATLIVAISIPFSVIATFVMMYFSGMTLNIMSLGGLALGVGMLVDNAIVIIENIYRHLQMGKSRKAAAIDGAMEIAGAITASTATTIVVFLPIIFIQGMVGDLFKEIALTVAFSLLASLLVALTVIPTMAGLLLKNTNTEVIKKENFVYRSYRKLITWSLNHRIVVVILTTLILVSSIFGMTKVGTEFMPSQDSGTFTIGVELENGAKLNQTIQVIEKIETVILDNSNVELVTSTIGTGNELGDAVLGSSENAGDIFVKLVDKESRTASTDDIMKDIKSEIEIPESTAVLTYSANQSEGMSGDANTISIMLLEDDKELLHTYADELTKRLNDEVDGVEGVESSIEESKPEFHFVTDKDKAFKYGLTSYQVSTFIRDSIQGSLATTLSKDGKETEVRVKLSGDMSSKETLEDLKITTPTGKQVALKEIGVISKAQGPVTVARSNAKDAITLAVEYKDSDLGAMTKKIEKVIEEMKEDLEIEESTEIKFGGDAEMMEDAFKDLIFALVLAVILVFMVMACLFESLMQPLIIMFTLPLAITGVVFGLLSTGYAFGITAFIGIIILAGIVVNNAIVFLDYTNQLTLSGKPLNEALIEAGLTRMKPIIMTAFTTILGLLPLAIGTGDGSQMQAPMAVAVIGGLFSSTLLTLVVIPVVYSLVETLRKLPKKMGRIKQAIKELDKE